MLNEIEQKLKKFHKENQKIISEYKIKLQYDKKITEIKKKKLNLKNLDLTESKKRRPTKSTKQRNNRFISQN